MNNQDRTAISNATDLDAAKGWEFQIGDLVKAEGECNGETWEEYLVVIGRIWSDEGAATYFDYCEERIQPGRNYFCRLTDKRQYTGFYSESELVRLAKGGQNAA